MISTSIIYFIFLVCTVIIYYVAPGKYKNYILILASLVFYMYVKLSYVLIIMSIIVANYLIGIKIGNSLEKKIRTRYLYLSFIINIGILVYFKYWDFLINTMFNFLGITFIKGNFLLLNVILPLGISYYIFQTIGYILDIYRGSRKAEIDFSKFSLYTLFFPKLLVGPIERAKNLLPQLSPEHTFDKKNLIEGCKLITWGLFKKLVVADRISLYVDAVYSNLPQHNSSTFYVVTLLYPIQVYADFSGYTDIALGTAKLFGINLMDNFKQPLFAKNVSDFWRRWHISLSSWVNDYIFNPIVFKRRDWGNVGVCYALFVSFIVIGIWHGASWNFLLFGIIQASAMMIEMLTKNRRKKVSKIIPAFIYNKISIILTFLFFAFSLLIFRTTSFIGLTQAFNIMRSKPGELFIDRPSTILFIIIGVSILFISDYRKEYGLVRHRSMWQQSWIVQQISYSLLLIYIIIAGVFDGGQFIYFAF